MARLTTDLILSLRDNVSGPARGVGRSLAELDRRQRAAAAHSAAFDTLLNRRQRRASGAAADLVETSRLTADNAAGMGRMQAMSLGGAAAAAAEVIIPLTIAEGIRQTAVAAADFESSLTGIQKKAGTTALQTAKLGEEIKALATSGELAVPIEDIMAAYERGAASGLPLDELREFASLSAKAADSFDMTAEEVGNSAAGFKAGLGIPIDEMEQYFDLINGLADTGIADEKDIISFLDRAGASLKQYGLSAKEAAAYGSSVLNLKMAPDVGANALSTLTGKLLSPGSKKAKKSLAGIAGDLQSFNKLQKSDPNAAVLKFLESINKLDKFKATELLGGFIGDGFDDEVLRMANGIDEVKKNLNYAGGTDWFGSLDKSYALKLDDMWSQWQLLKNDMSVLMIDVGTAGMPALKSGLEAAKYLVDQIGQGFEAFKAKIDMTEIGVAGEAIANLGAAITTLLGIDTSKSAIPKFFEEIADAANDVAAAVNRVDQFFRKPFENWGNETVTPEKQAAIKAMQPEEQYDPSGSQSYREWMQAKRARDLAGGAGPVQGTMSPNPANIPAVNVTSTPSRIAAEKTLSERAAKRGIQGPSLPRDLGFGAYGPQIPTIPTPAPRPQRIVPVPAPRPPDAALNSPTPPQSLASQPEAPTMADIKPRPQPFKPVEYQPLRPAVNPYANMPVVSSVPFAAPTVDTTGFDAAKLKALEAGTEMQASLGITAKPIVDISSASSALTVVRQLAAELRGIPGLVAAASAASAGAASGGSGRVDYDGLQADTTHPGF